MRCPKGNLTWIIVNDAPRVWSATLEVSGVAGRALHKYQVTSEQHDQPGLRVQPLGEEKLAAAPASFAGTLPAQSLTIYSTYDLSHAQRGVIAE